MSKNAIRIVGACLVALLVFGVVAGACGAMSGGSDSSSTTVDAQDDTTPDTVERNGDPAFCTAIAGFQSAYLLVSEPADGATPGEVEADWNALAAASSQMVETAPSEMTAFVNPVVGAFDTLRQDADAVGYQYGTFDDLASAPTIDPSGEIAQSAFALFTYEDERCPVAGDGDGDATTSTTAAAG